MLRPSLRRYKPELSSPLRPGYDDKATDRLINIMDLTTALCPSVIADFVVVLLCAPGYTCTPRGSGRPGMNFPSSYVERPRVPSRKFCRLGKSIVSSDSILTLLLWYRPVLGRPSDGWQCWLQRACHEHGISFVVMVKGTTKFTCINNSIHVGEVEAQGG